MPSKRETLQRLALQLHSAVDSGNRKKGDRIMLAILQTVGATRPPTRAEMNAYWNAAKQNAAKRRRHG